MYLLPRWFSKRRNLRFRPPRCTLYRCTVESFFVEARVGSLIRCNGGRSGVAWWPVVHHRSCVVLLSCGTRGATRRRYHHNRNKEHHSLSSKLYRKHPHSPPEI
ncbi:unnamed protein product [Callosobruchus maculatus]|uniref:Uncharacterized protein n=1 Tax=Callosobruchus maculatus TaxID=64391 RepID=A0A653CT33_CALMS|nr:unnamed protein product [Callosobruchus maculatus]